MTQPRKVNRVAYRSLKKIIRDAIERRDRDFLVKELARPSYSFTIRTATRFHYENTWGAGTFPVEILTDEIYQQQTKVCS